ncbi:MAG: thiamine pyrophosphate-binding protein, partial [Verrucomicrobiota bacterium]|nr:thiamine pyrophosphate-binding protein [Verrucomicrobiota bacterium]
MSDTVADFLIKRINEWRFKRIYGFPGDGINGIIGAIQRAGDKVDYVQTRHEELAAFMACAHAKFTGQV